MVILVPLPQIFTSNVENGRGKWALVRLLHVYMQELKKFQHVEIQLHHKKNEKMGPLICKQLLNPPAYATTA